MRSFLAFFLLFFVFLMNCTFSYSQEVEFFSPTYFDQPKNDYDPLRFLETEDIVFEVCEDSDLITEMSGKIICGTSSKDVDLILSHKSNCFIGQIKTITCDESTLALEYKADGESFVYERELIKTKESQVIDYVLQENFEELDDPLELSYYLIVHNEIKGLDEISQEIYEKLRDLRDNDDKCWPKGLCNIDTTAEILHNLERAGYKQDTRLLEDGEIYLNSNVRGESDDEGFVRVEFDMGSSTRDTNCLLYIDNKLEENETFDEDTNFSREDFDSTFNITCDRDVDEINIFIEDPNQGDKNVSLSDKREYDYELIGHYCYGKSSCNPETSLYALLTYGKDLEYYNEVFEYLENLTKKKEDNQNYIFSKSNSRYSSMFLRLDKDEKIGNYVKFFQNNDGSWGTSSKKDSRILETYWGSVGLSGVKDSKEHITDSQNWVYFEEPSSGWSSIKQNSLAFLTIEKYIRPFLVLEYTQELNGTHIFKLTNPSIFPINDVEVSFGDDLEEFIDYSKSIGIVDEKEQVLINVTSNNNALSKKGGNLIITGIVDDKKTELVKVPIVIATQDIIDIEKSEYFYSLDFPVINLEIKRLTELELSCKFSDSLLGEKKDITLKQETTRLILKNTALLQGKSTVNLVCSYGSDSIVFTKEIDISQQSQTFDIVQLDNMLVIEDFSEEKIVLRSTVSENQDISLSFENVFNGLVQFEEPNFILRANEEKTIYFQKLDSSLLESLSNSNDSLVIQSSLGYSKKYPFSYQFTPQNPISVLMIIIGVLAVLLIGLIVYRAIQLHKENDDEEIYEDTEEDFDFGELELH